ncbi:MAG: hypothetical protein JWO28_2327, partial [Hyphomicrobiales bacterium]|nr:hypothetical protein [Hyphomicrobiales bacterium]
APDLEIENTEFGFHYAAQRQGPPLADGTPTLSTRVSAIFMPTGRIIPLAQYQFFLFEVPADDYWTNTFLICHGPKPFDRAKQKSVLGLDNEKLWNERDCIYQATPDNLYCQDRSQMDVTWSGLTGLAPEDASISVSMGPIVDRENETLVAADAAVVRLRDRVLENLRRVEAGEEPMGLSIADYSKVRSFPDTNVPKGERWQDLVPDNLGLGGKKLERV